jgi:arginine deiminase
MSSTLTSSRPALGPGADSEVGRLRSVLLHRPGPELSRLTPRNNDSLLFDGIPWVARAQDEHDAFAAELTSRGVHVRYLTDLLTQALEIEAARTQAVADLLGGAMLGQTLRARLAGPLAELAAADLTDVLVAGLRNDELGTRLGVRTDHSIVTSLLAEDAFLLEPLPNLLFTRDSSVWLPRGQVAVTSLAMPARKRETALTGLIYAHHPDFAGTSLAYRPEWESLEGGDVLLLGQGVVAVGVGERTAPAGVERLAGALLGRGLAETVLAVPIAQRRATMHLDTIVTMVDTDTVLMYANVARDLVAWTITPSPATEGAVPGADLTEVTVSEPAPFLEAAASALGIDRVRSIDTGLDPVTAEREQWDDGNNTLALAPRLAVAYERNVETNRRLEEAGIEVIAIAGSELGSGRGGPRCMSCPVARDPL